MSAKVGTRVWLAVWLIPTAFFLAVVTTIHCWVRIPPPDRLDATERRAVIEALRAGLKGQAGSLVELPAAPGGVVVVCVWSGGSLIARVRGEGRSLAVAVREAADELADLKLTPAAVERVRLSVDRVRGEAPLLRSVPGLRLFSVHPGVDGVVARHKGTATYLLPLDLHRHNLLTSEVPLEFIPDLKVGVSLAGVEALAATRLGLAPSAWRAANVTLRRFRTDSFVEAPRESRDRDPIPLYRGVPPRPSLSSSALRAGAIAGGKFLVAHLAPNGRYIYEVDLESGQGTDPKKAQPYSLPRHSGTTYFLAELYRLTGEQFLVEPIERAFAHLAELVDAGGCEGTFANGARWACVVDKGSRAAGLGGAALTVVALIEYRRATGKGTYDDLAARLIEWILHMQRADGSFVHVFDVANKKKYEPAQHLYFSGEATLALARAYQAYGDPRTLVATRRGLDHMIEWYDFFAGGLFYGEEHWTCIAAEAIWPHLKDDRYREFCNGYGEFLRLQQPGPSDFGDSPDMAGTYGFTPFVLANNTPAGSRSEAMISAYELGVRHGRPSAALRRQILAAAHYSLGQQIGADGAFWMPKRGAPIGGVPASPVEPSVRIDYVQHVCSALIRTAVLLERSQLTQDE